MAGKSTLNRLELTPSVVGRDERYKKIRCDQEAVDALWVRLFLESHEKAPDSIVIDLDTTDMPLHGEQEGRFFHGYYGHYCYLPLYISCGHHLLLRVCARPRAMPSVAVCRKCNASSYRSAKPGPKRASFCAAMPVSAAKHGCFGAKQTKYIMFWGWRATTFARSHSE